MASDAERSPRGMALEFRLPGGGLPHMTMINTPMFFAAMPQTFLDKMRALKPDPATGKPDPDALEAFAATHPDSVGQAALLADNNPPVSYANSAFYGISHVQVHQSERQSLWLRLRRDTNNAQQATAFVAVFPLP